MSREWDIQYYSTESGMRNCSNYSRQLNRISFYSPAERTGNAQDRTKTKNRYISERDMTFF